MVTWGSVGKFMHESLRLTSQYFVLFKKLLAILVDIREPLRSALELSIYQDCLN